MPERKCRTCGAIKALNEFPRNKRRKDGIDTRCSACNRAAVRVWRESDPERYARLHSAGYYRHKAKRNAKAREWAEQNPGKVAQAKREWVENNREKSRAIKKAWAERNPDAVRAKNQRWAAESREERNAKQRAWKRRNRAKVALDNHRRRARHRYTPGAEQYIDTLYGDVCGYCGAPATTIDHITPLAAGGANRWSNLTAACLSCNASKGDRSMLLWMLQRAGRTDRLAA